MQISIEMKFIIEQINETDCRIVDIDFSNNEREKVEEIVVPAIIEQDGKVWHVKEVGNSPTLSIRKDWLDRDEEYWIFGESVFDASQNASVEKRASLKGLKRLIFSEGIEKIGIVKNPSLSEVVLPESLTIIGGGAFSECSNLSSINIPEGVEEIGVEAFRGCSSLPPFPWPKALKTVDISAFTDMMTPLEEYTLEIPDSIEEIKGSVEHLRINKCIISAKSWSVFDASKLGETIEKISIPEGVREINSEFPFVKHVSIPSTIEKIRCDAFGCLGNNRVEISCSEETLKRIMGMPGALNRTAVKEIVIPNGATEVNVEDCPELTALTIPSTVTLLENICDLPKLETLKLPDSITEIYDVGLQFHGLTADIEASPKVWKLICSSLVGLIGYKPKNAELTIPEGVELIKKECFRCGEITAINLPSTLREIGSLAFERTKLKKCRTSFGTYHSRNMRVFRNRYARNNYIPCFYHDL